MWNLWTHWSRLGKWIETWIETWIWIETWNIGWDLDMDLIETRNIGWDLDMDWDTKHWLRLGTWTVIWFLRPWKMYQDMALKHGKVWDTERSKYALWLGHEFVTWIRTWKWIETWKYGDMGLMHGLRCGLIHGKIKSWVETWTHGSRPGKLMHGAMAWDMGWDPCTWIDTWIWDIK
jgi:hypothetical protein